MPWFSISRKMLLKMIEVGLCWIKERTRRLVLFLFHYFQSISCTSIWIAAKGPHFHDLKRIASILYQIQYERPPVIRVIVPLSYSWTQELADISTRYDSLIPGMAPWKQNMLKCLLAVAVGFSIFLWMYLLCGAMEALPEISLKVIFHMPP